MKMKLKRAAVLLLAAALLAALTAAAHADYTEGYFEYVLGEDRVEITGYFGDESETTVPARIAGYPVCVIRSGAFSNAKTLAVIHLPDCIMEIQEGAFSAGQSVVYSGVDASVQPDSPSPSPAVTEESSTPPPATEQIKTTSDPLTHDSAAVMSDPSDSGTGSTTAVVPMPGQATVTETDTASEELELDSGDAPEEPGKNETTAAPTENKEQAAEAAENSGDETPEARREKILKTAAEVVVGIAVADLIAMIAVFISRKKKETQKHGAGRKRR